MKFNLSKTEFLSISCDLDFYHDRQKDILSEVELESGDSIFLLQFKQNFNTLTTLKGKFDEAYSRYTAVHLSDSFVLDLTNQEYSILLHLLMYITEHRFITSNFIFNTFPRSDYLKQTTQERLDLSAIVYTKLFKLIS